MLLVIVMSVARARSSGCAPERFKGQFMLPKLRTKGHFLKHLFNEKGASPACDEVPVQPKPVVVPAVDVFHQLEEKWL